MKGLKIRVPDVPAYTRHAARLRRQPDADRVRRGLPGAAERHRRRAGEPADDDRGEEVLRGAEAHHADRPHRRRPDHAGGAARVEQAERRREEDLLRRGAEAAARATAQIKKREAELVDEFKKKGIGVHTVNRQSFVDAVLKNVSVESLGFDKKDYDRIVASSDHPEAACGRLPQGHRDWRARSAATRSAPQRESRWTSTPAQGDGRRRRSSTPPTRRWTCRTPPLEGWVALALFWVLGATRLLPVLHALRAQQLGRRGPRRSRATC